MGTPIQLRGGITTTRASKSKVRRCDLPGSSGSPLATHLRIDFRTLKTWIEHCCDNQDRECTADPNWKPVEGMELIDVRNRSVVKAPNQAQYAALSYVWGTQKPDDESNGLLAQLPRTIGDAIQATRVLGLDYLWVDKYCIPQGKEVERGHQIKNMHRIYQQAYVTIVASAGIGPDHGLSGLSRPWIFPTHIIVDDRLFVGLPEHPLRRDGAVGQSRWNTRAWTYQEEFCSRRILYFTDSQIIFNCKQQSVGIDDPIRSQARSEPTPLIVDPQYDINLVFGEDYVNNSLDMSNHIRAAMERQITYKMDRINTIAGLLSQMKADGKILGHLSGVPIWKNCISYWIRPFVSWEAGFLTGLAWIIDHQEGRRSEFPSWSWAGWKGRHRCNKDVRHESVSIWFELQLNDSTKPIIVEDKASFDCVDPQKRHSPEAIFPSKEFWPILESRGWKDSLCRFIHIEAPTVHFRCKRSGNRGWQLASLEDYPIHEDDPVNVDILVSEEPQLEEALAVDTFRGLVFFSPNWQHVFVIVLRDFSGYSEKIGNWQAQTNLFVLPQVDNENGSKVSLREKNEIHSEENPIYDYKEITGDRRERVRLG